MKNNISFIDLFCGIGEIRLGMEKQGLKCIVSCDINSEYRKTYYENFEEKPLGGITKIDNSAILSHDILCADFSSQLFSIFGEQKGIKDTRLSLRLPL